MRPLKQITGEAEFNEIFFTDAKVPKENLLGDIGGGWQVAMTTLLHERGTLGFALSGMLEAQVQKVVALAKSRERPRRDRPRPARERVDRAAGAKLTNYRALTSLMKTGMPGPEGSAVKLAWSEANQRLTKLAMEILEGEDDGYWRHQQLRSRGNTIEAGTSEILRNIVAERVLGLPRSALMQFAFTDEQELLRREAREALGNGGWSRDEIAGAELSFLDRAVLYEEGGRANVGESLFDDSRPEDEQFATLALEAVGIAAKALELGVEYA